MTGKERNVLDEIRGDVKKLLEFMATYQEKSHHCEAKFSELDMLVKWNRKMLLRWSGGLAVVMFLLGLAVKALKVI